jgi:hypothetical protein
MNNCFECGYTNNLHDHHVVPRSLGGTKTIRLCEKCHGLVHGRKLYTTTLTIAALTKKRNQGVRISGRVPLGYKLADDGVGLVPDANGQAALAKIVEMHRVGYRVAAIARQMTEDGYQTSCGGIWRSATVAAVLNRQQKLQS